MGPNEVTIALRQRGDHIRIASPENAFEPVADRRGEDIAHDGGELIGRLLDRAFKQGADMTGQGHHPVERAAPGGGEGEGRGGLVAAGRRALSAGRVGRLGLQSRHLATY